MGRRLRRVPGGCGAAWRGFGRLRRRAAATRRTVPGSALRLLGFVPGVLVAGAAAAGAGLPAQVHVAGFPSPCRLGTDGGDVGDDGCSDDRVDRDCRRVVRFAAHGIGETPSAVVLPR